MNEAAMKTKCLMSGARAARYLGRSRQWVWAKGRKGKLPTFWLDGKYLYSLAEEITALKNEENRG